MLGHLHKVFPRVGIAAAFPEDGGNVFGDVAGKAVQTVAFNEGHHVVFQREQIIGAHSQATYSRRWGRGGDQENFLPDEARLRCDGRAREARLLLLE